MAGGQSDPERTIVPSRLTPRARLEFIGRQIGRQAYRVRFGESTDANEIGKQEEYSEQITTAMKMFFGFNYLLIMIFGSMDLIYSNLHNLNHISYYTLTIHGTMLTIPGMIASALPEVWKDWDNISELQSNGYKHSGVFAATFGSVLLLIAQMTPTDSFAIITGLLSTTIILLLFDQIVSETDPENINLGWFIEPLDIKTALKSGFRQTFTQTGVRKSVLIGLLMLWFTAEVNMILFQIQFDEVLMIFGWKVVYPQPDIYYEIPVIIRLAAIISSLVAIIYQFISTLNKSEILNSTNSKASRRQVGKATVARIGLRVLNATVTIAAFISLAVLLNNKVYDTIFVAIVISAPSAVSLYLYSNFIFVPHVILSDNSSILNATRTSWRIASGNRIGIVTLQCSATTSGYGLFLVFILMSSLATMLLDVFLTMTEGSDLFMFIPLTISLGFYLVFRIFTFVDAFDQLEKKRNNQ